MAQKKVAFGLVGTGDVAEHWLAPALAKSSNGALQAVCSRSLPRAMAFADTYGTQSTRTYDSYDKMIADPSIDAVIIATPDATHARMGIAAAHQGKHIFVEKPMATSAKEAEDLIVVCGLNQVQLGVAYHHRWSVPHKLVAQLLAAKGEEDRPLHLRIEWCSPAPDAEGWRAKGPDGKWWALAALGTHCVDLACWWLQPSCGPVVAMSASQSDHKFRSGRDETVCATLTFENGCIAELLMSVALPCTKRIELTTASDRIVCVDTLGPRGGGSVTVNGTPLPFKAADPYQRELEDFADAVLIGREPTVTGTEGYANVVRIEQIMFAAMNARFG